MKNTPNSTDNSFRAFLQQVFTKRDMQVFAVKGLTFLFSAFISLAFAIAVYNALIRS